MAAVVRTYNKVWLFSPLLASSLPNKCALALPLCTRTLNVVVLGSSTSVSCDFLNCWMFGDPVCYIALFIINKPRNRLDGFSGTIEFKVLRGHLTCPFFAYTRGIGKLILCFSFYLH